MNVIYAADDNYALPVLISIESLLSSNKDGDIKIFLLNSGLKDENQQMIQKLVQSFNQTISFIDITNKLMFVKNKFNSLHGSYLTYARLFIASILPDDIDKAIYIDCDTLVIDNITNYYQSDFPNIIGMCLDMIPKYHKKQIRLYKKNYYNAGIIFFDIKNYRKYKLEERILNFLSSYNFSLEYHDQDVINIALENYIFKIPCNYNLMSPIFYLQENSKIRFANRMDDNYYSDKELQNALSFPKIIHFTNDPILIRPWFRNGLHPYMLKYKQLQEKYIFMYGEKDCRQKRISKFLGNCYIKNNNKIIRTMISIIFRFHFHLFK